MYNQYFTPYDEIAELQLLNLEIEKEMQNVRLEALDKFRTIALHPEFLEDIALSICYGYMEDYEPSKNIIDILDLSKMEICSLVNDIEGFKEFYTQDLEREQYL